MVDSANQKKSPIILLLVLSVLVITTLVVASMYFVRPNLELELKERVAQNLQQAGVNDTQIHISGRDGVLSGEVESLAESKKAEQTVKDTCGIRFVDNQLLVKSAD